ncbi:glycoside hydrolase family 9 protein [Muricauda sp. CAU 1633]|uniref:glycoside hydrolase family 9 protein n=1 Tax=Allomuricauda sp. CAU 1633 TaxID=2816036 RepID=UPI001A8F4782|nr:glycoside hydrolase family 9 protein [Muricauda sp. CAU 1633]MBO0322210.1 glycoside hydrolase family 9 protein [Muricauda sp. CAU 1633]
MKSFPFVFLFFTIALGHAQSSNELQNQDFIINDSEYLERRGANVMLAHDFYPESHQGGVGIIQNGIRVATNGDLRLEATPGQWQPVPKVGERMVDREQQEISIRMAYPDESKNKKGFNPIDYPDLNFAYTLKIVPSGESFKIIVDLDEPLPKEWIGRVGMNLELFPGILFGKSYYMDRSFGLFNRQANGPGSKNAHGIYELKPLAMGKKLVIAPETPEQTLVIENMNGSPLQLLDGRAQHSNGWFIVRSQIAPGATKNAVQWLVTPKTLENFTYSPVVQVSQVGYHPSQQKIAVIETDKTDETVERAYLFRIGENGALYEVLSETPKSWGDFLRYRYYQFDFSGIKEPGMYKIGYGQYTTHPFQISSTVYQRHIWQPTLEYFLPVQMCHMQVNDRYKVWHGLCHMDDARMAPTNTNHFDGYLQGPETLTQYLSGEHVPGINIGGWHDAGDYDLRVESQASTIHGLSQIYEIFAVGYDNTAIDQSQRTVDLLTPDGKPDILQQIEHGALSIVGGYKSMGRFYRGIIVPTLEQYVLLGDPLNHSDNEIFSNKVEDNKIALGQSGAPDDRWVFTEKNPFRELGTAAALTATARALKGYNDTLAEDCSSIALEIWDLTEVENPLLKVGLAVELLQTTKDKKYADYLVEHADAIASAVSRLGWVVGPVLPLVDDPAFHKKITDSVHGYFKEVEDLGNKTPYGIPYEPNIWGAGWGIQNFGVRQYFLHTSFPQIFPKTYLLNAMNFILGVHPGINTSSFASGVGSRSLTQAYGVNRGDFSFIPGGIGSGTALIRPDFPELLEWPFLWQQTEYVLGGGTTDYLFLILAADELLNKP